MVQTLDMTSHIWQGRKLPAKQEDVETHMSSFAGGHGWLSMQKPGDCLAKPADWPAPPSGGADGEGLRSACIRRVVA